MSSEYALNDELCADLEEQITTDNTENISENKHNGNDINTVNYESIPELKKGINLPKNDSEWSTANDYFKWALQPNDPITLLRYVNDWVRFHSEH